MSNPPPQTPTPTDCRMYESRFPEIGTPVMIQVKSVGDVATKVSLLEYNNIEGMILLSDLSRRRSVGSLLKLGRIEPAMVLRVNAEKGYIDLSKKRLSEEDARICEERYSKSKMVHSIMQNVAETMNVDLEDLYIHVGWPLYKKYGHAVEAFKLIVNNPDSVLGPLTREIKEIGPDGKEVTKVVPALSDDVKDALVSNIRRQMTPKPLKIRADIDMKCFELDGVLHIKEAMQKAESVGTKECPVKVELITPPAYVLTTQTLDKEQGMKVLTNAVAACATCIERYNGKLTVKESPRTVSEREDKLLSEQIYKLGRHNTEVGGDEDSEVEEYVGMGSFDLDGQASWITD